MESGPRAGDPVGMADAPNILDSARVGDCMRAASSCSTRPAVIRSECWRRL